MYIDCLERILGRNKKASRCPEMEVSWKVCEHQVGDTNEETCLTFFKQLCENHEVDLAHASSMEDVVQYVLETMKFVDARRKKRAGARTNANDRTPLIKARHTKDRQLEKCRGDPDTKVRAQIMDYKHKNRSTKAKIDNLRSEKTSYIKLFERVSTLSLHVAQ